MVKTKSSALLFLLAIGQIAVALSDLPDAAESENEALRKKGCEKFCCLNVTGNETVGGDVTVGGDLTVNDQSNPRAITVENDILVNGQSVAALFNFGSFYFVPERAAIIITPGQLIPFPRIGAGTTVVAGSGNTKFTIPTIGAWIISWSVSFSGANISPTQLGLVIDNTLNTASKTSSFILKGKLYNSFLFQTTKPNTVVSLQNVGSSTFTLTQGSIFIDYNSNISIPTKKAS